MKPIRKRACADYGMIQPIHGIFRVGGKFVCAEESLNVNDGRFLSASHDVFLMHIATAQPVKHCHHHAEIVEVSFNILFIRHFLAQEFRHKGVTFALCNFRRRQTIRKPFLDDFFAKGVQPAVVRLVVKRSRVG